MAALAAAALAASAPAAFAYTEKVEVTDVGGGHVGLKISQQAEPGLTAGSGAPVDNHLVLRFEKGDRSDSMIVVQEGNPAAVLEPGSQCSTRSQTEVACAATSVSRYRIFTGLGNDTVDLTQLSDKGILPATIDGGPGADAILGGPEDDTLNGDGANGNSATVSLAVGVARLARLHHAAKLTLVEHARSHKGPKTVEVARRLP